MKKCIAATVLSMAMSMMIPSVAFAAGWQQDVSGWSYDDGNGRFYNSWHWIDGNGDGIEECYSFGPDGYIYVDRTTPDGYIVNESGAWVVDGKIQTKTVETGMKKSPTSKEILTYLEKRDDGIIALAIDYSKPEATSGATNIYTKKVMSNEKDDYYNSGWRWQLYKTVGSNRYYCPLAFNEEGYLLVNTVTPDGYYVDSYGVLNIAGKQVYHSDVCSSFPFWSDLIDLNGNLVPDKNNCDLNTIDVRGRMYGMGGLNVMRVDWGTLVYNHCFYDGVDGYIGIGSGFGQICVDEINRPGK